MSADDWLEKSWSFLRGAQFLLTNQSGIKVVAPSIGMLSWQTAENSLKAVCAGHGIPKGTRGHDLSILMNHIGRNSLMTPQELVKVSEVASTVTDSGVYNSARYPNRDLMWWEGLSENRLKETV